MQSIISLQPIHYKGEECIGLYFSQTSVESLVRRIKGIKFSMHYKCWYLPLSKENYMLLKQSLEGKVIFELGALQQYLIQRKAQEQPTDKLVTKQKAKLIIEQPLSGENQAAYRRYLDFLQLKGYSPRTIKTYTQAFIYLLRILGSVAVQTLTKQHVQSYLLWLIKEKGCSDTHIHTVINSLKFYFEVVVMRKDKTPRCVRGK